MPKPKSSEVEELMESGLIAWGDSESFQVERISTGIAQLDGILKGGLPRRRISIINGDYSSGKSFIVQLLMREAISEGLKVAYIDTEQTYDPIWWDQCGLPLGKILVSQPSTGEEATDLALALVKAGVDVVAIDSLAALVPHLEAEQEAKQTFIGIQARLINRMLRMLLAAKHNSVVVCTNQLRETIGPGPADPMPGGRGQGFFTSLLLRTRREDWIEERGKRVGFYMRVICRKSKVGPPFGECLLPFHFRGEIDMLSLLLERALEAGLASHAKGSAWYSLHIGGQEHKQLGKNGLVTLLREDAELRGYLEAALGDV